MRLNSKGLPYAKKQFKEKVQGLGTNDLKWSSGQYSYNTPQEQKVIRLWYNTLENSKVRNYTIHPDLLLSSNFLNVIQSIPGYDQWLNGEKLYLKSLDPNNWSPDTLIFSRSRKKLIPYTS